MQAVSCGRLSRYSIIRWHHAGREESAGREVGRMIDGIGGRERDRGEERKEMCGQKMYVGKQA